MKLKYIFASIVATLALAVGCQKEADHYLKEVKVSSSYLTFPAEGGSVNVTVSATQDWSINTIPEWITATPANGSAGETKVTFTAIATTQTRENDFTITSGTVGQTIKARQVAEVVEPETVNVAAALALIKAVDKGDGGSYNVSGTYRVKGIVCKISDISVSYGNATYYLSDDGKFDSEKALQVYRGLWLEGGPFTKGNEFAVGDELTIEGQLMSYKGTPETAEKTAYVVSIKKSLIGVEGTELQGVEEGQGVTEYPVEGGSIKVYIMTKGNGFHVNIPAEAKSWLHIEDFGTDYVTLSADANEGGDRNVTVGFTTTSGNETYSCEQTLSQKGAIVDATVAEFLAAEVGNTQYRLTGVISKVVKAEYGNINLKDYSGEVYVYGVGAKGDFEKLGLKEGDIVTLVGKRDDHNGPQMKGGQYEKHTPVSRVTISEFLAAGESKEVWYMVTGKVTKPSDEEIAAGSKWDITTYGNFNLVDGTGSVYVYGVSTGVGGQTKKFSTLGVKEGDELTIIGYRTSHDGLNQVGGGMYVSHETPSASGEVFAKVTTAPTNWAGDYLIVFGSGAHATVSGSDLIKTVDVTITDGVITATDAVKAAAIKVAAIEGGYSITLPGGKFLTFTENKNKVVAADAAAPMSFAITESGAKIGGTDTASNARVLFENATGDSPFYRAYKEDKLGQEGYSLPTLYKLTAVN